MNRYELGPIGTNCYVVRADDSAGEAVVVDPGAEAARILLVFAPWPGEGHYRGDPKVV